RSPAALETWNQAADLYQQLGNIIGYTQAKIYQATALQTLGLYSQNIKTLTEINHRMQDEPNSSLKAQALLRVGSVLTRIGEYQKSEASLNSGLAIAKELDDQALIADALINLGNNARLQQQPESALELYQRAIAVDSDPNLQLRAKLNRLDVLISLGQTEAAGKQTQEITQLLARLTPQQTTIQGKVSLASHLLKLETQPREIANLLTDAVQQAQSLNIRRIEADALGVLGNLYEQNRQLAEAEQITEKALLIAQSINATELTYQWQWQLGRVLQAQGKIEPAIAAYSQATHNLQSLRSDLTAISSDVQYSFREKIEPVYRELAALLLHPQASQADLNQGRQIIESLQVAELDNFFRQACLDVEPQNIEEIDPQAAVIYSIILPDRLAVILSQPGQPLQYHQTAIDSPQVIEQVFEDFYANLSPFLAPSNPLQPNQTFYDWLIRPLEDRLETNNSNTLVFVLDGIMRGIPVAALHDGNQYLVQKYSLALTPGLQLLAAPAVNFASLKTITGGITESRQGFEPLPHVEAEVNKIASLVPSQILLNENFTRDSLREKIASLPYPVVHLATHGQFSSQAEDTFLLTWNDRINVKNLDRLLQNREFAQDTPIELLILSACQTAAGDNKAALGLAGVAIRSGARSTVATLWSVQDDSTTELITQFYQALDTPGISKAEALRQAQLNLLQSSKYEHPFYWSAFILLGNWL
ncbi:CHAT domain-containing protein, partial [Pleurocapsales cyanobacterium LEGE 10410]|nr:CHAT domain-containing protein [Pleurocapsales cyanobacterium LEGE 10410]